MAKTYDEISPLQKTGFKFNKYNVGYLINPLPDDLYHLLDIVKYDFIIEDNNNAKYLVYHDVTFGRDRYSWREDGISPCSWNRYGIGQRERDCNSNTILHNVPFIVPLNDIQTITQIKVMPTLEQRTPYIFIKETDYVMYAYINEPFLMLKEGDESCMSIYRNSKSIQPGFERFLDDELKKSTIPVLTKKQLKYDDTHKEKCYGWYSWPNE